MQNRLAILFLNTFVGAVIIGYVVFPLFSSLQESFSTDGSFPFSNYVSIFSVGTYFSAIYNTLAVSVATVLGAGVLGLSLAFIFWRYDFALKPILTQILILPIGLPPLIGVFAFQFLYSESGVMPRALQRLFQTDAVAFEFEGFSAVLLVHIYSFFVHFFLFGYTSLMRLDFAQVEVAYTFGASRARVFFKILLPHLRPAILSASLIVLALSIASFTAPLLFASKSRFLTVEIYNQKLSGSFGLASALTIVLLFISLSLLFIFERLNSKQTSISSRGSPRSTSLKSISLLGSAFLWLSAVFVCLPLLALAVMSFSEAPLSVNEIFPSQFGFGNYSRMFADERFYEPFLNSFLMAIVASFFNLIFGVVSGVMIAERLIFFRPLALVIFFLPIALPATALGVNLIAAFNAPTVWTLGQSLVGTAIMLPLAYFIRHLPFVTRSVSSALESFDHSLYEASSTLGISPIASLRRVAIPMLAPAIGSGFLFTFISSFGEFPCSILLYSPEFAPISVAIFSSLRLGEFGVASAQGVLLLIIVFGLNFLSTLIFKTGRPSVPIGF